MTGLIKTYMVAALVVLGLAGGINDAAAQRRRTKVPVKRAVKAHGLQGLWKAKGSGNATVFMDTVLHNMQFIIQGRFAVNAVYTRGADGWYNFYFSDMPPVIRPPKELLRWDEVVSIDKRMGYFRLQGDGLELVWLGFWHKKLGRYVQRGNPFAASGPQVSLTFAGN